MMRKLPWILLALSITFNFAFTTGLLEAQSARQAATEPEKTPGEKSQLVAERLGLSDEQRRAYVDARERLWRDGSELRQAMALAREDRRAELAKPSPDLARVAEIEARVADLSHQMRLLAAEHLEQFAGRLTPDQRRQLGGLMRSQAPRMTQIPPALKGFDTNGDGVLDEQERQAARRHLQELRQGRGEQPRTRPVREPEGRGARGGAMREEMLRRFDTNGDGVLDEAERAEAMKARRQREMSSAPVEAGGKR